MSPSKGSTRLDASLLGTEVEPASETSFFFRHFRRVTKSNKKKTVSVRHDMVFHKTRADRSNYISIIITTGQMPGNSLSKQARVQSLKSFVAKERCCS